MNKQQPPKPKKFRILVADDHPVTREGIKAVLASQKDLVVCGEASSGQEALPAIQNFSPDAVVLDLSLGKDSGLEIIREIRQKYSKLPVLVFSMKNEDFYAERALELGAHGFVPKALGAEALVEGLRRVLQGEIYLTKKTAAGMMTKCVGRTTATGISAVPKLTNRELEVLELLGQGLDTRILAEKLHRSVKTVDSHIDNLKRKLRLSSIVELRQFAFRWAEESGAGSDA